MVVFPPAKINLGLNILDKRPDGFHNLETVFYPIDLYDVLEVIVCPDADIDFEFTQTGVPLDCAPEKNLCYKAFQRIKSSFPEIEPIKVHLHKTIPTGAGMGGGSSDGAFMLQLLKSIFNLTISDAVHKNMALELGSDCPFFLVNRPSLALGRGEIISHCPIQLKGFHILIVNPGIHINTGWAFNALDKDRIPNSLTQLAEIPINEWNKWVKNDFEKPVFHHYPEIASIKESLYEQGAVFASMSGSGSTVFGIFKDKPQALPHFPESYFCKWV
jgi:4-diphosphocytidyl-2-C-methyl-D-erythritol kinase